MTILVINLMLIFFFRLIINLNKNDISNFIFFLRFICLFNFNKFTNYIKIDNEIGFNIYSFIILILRLWIIGIILLFYEVKISEKIIYIIVIFSLILILVKIFITLNLIWFYFIFESRLILTYIIIIKWGLGEIRKLAGFYLLYYTIFFSLPFLYFVFILYFKYNITIIYYIEFNKIYVTDIYLFTFFIFTFFVKIPIYIVHYWLLKAHVEAPVIGSIILAAILLKLGVYGLIRFINIFNYNFYTLRKVVLYFRIFGATITRILCIRQVDLKILVAYSSVVHIGLILRRIITIINFRIKGRYIIIVSHGLCSSGLFYLVNLYYLISNRRLILLNKGLMNIYPRISLIWFFICSSNLSAPISINLICEIILLIGLINWNILILIILVILIFFRFLYSLNLFSYTQHGEFHKFQNLINFKIIHYFISLIHWIPLNLFIFNILLFL